MDENLIRNTRTYAQNRNLDIVESLGFGYHGNVHLALDKRGMRLSAVKAHRYTEAFRRECDAYERLDTLSITQIRGFAVPQLLGADETLLVLEMSIVSQPFILDFAAAYLDFPPEFSPEAWDYWEAEKREQFEGDWPEVQRVLAELEDLGIHMMDVRPGNIAFDRS